MRLPFSSADDVTDEKLSEQDHEPVDGVYVFSCSVLVRFCAGKNVLTIQDSV